MTEQHQQQSLLVFGYASRIFDDPHVATLIEHGSHLIPLPLSTITSATESEQTYPQSESICPSSSSPPPPQPPPPPPPAPPVAASSNKILVDRYDVRLLLSDFDWIGLSPSSSSSNLSSSDHSDPTTSGKHNKKKRKRDDTASSVEISQRDHHHDGDASLEIELDRERYLDLPLSSPSLSLPLSPSPSSPSHLPLLFSVEQLEMAHSEKTELLLDQQQDQNLSFSDDQTSLLVLHDNATAPIDGEFHTVAFSYPDNNINNNNTTASTNNLANNPNDGDKIPATDSKSIKENHGDHNCNPDLPIVQKNPTTASSNKSEFEKKLDRVLGRFTPEFDVPANIMLPPTSKMHKIIEETARFVGKQGGKMESQILSGQKSNPNFAFLNLSDELHPYYLFLRNRISRPHHSVPSSKSSSSPTAAAAVHMSKSSASLFSIMTSYGEESDDPVLMLIDKLVAYVKAKENAYAVLDLLRERQSDNPKLSFLMTSDPNHAIFMDRLERAMKNKPSDTPSPPPPGLVWTSLSNLGAESKYRFFR